MKHLKIKSLSIVSPSADRIARGLKTLEVRSWKPNLSSDEDLLIVENSKYLKEGDVDPNGFAVAVARISRVRNYVKNDISLACATSWDEGYYTWELSHVRVLKEKIKVPAKTGIYETEIPEAFLTTTTPLESIVKRRHYTTEEDNAYYATLPRKRSAVGVLILKDDKILLVKPNYRNYWLIPGGTVDNFESPLEAGVRECREELGTNVTISRLLCMDYRRGDHLTGDAYHSIFLGHLEENAELKIDQEELIGHEWVKPEIAYGWLNSHLALRVKSALKAIDENKTIYSENGDIKA